MSVEDTIMQQYPQFGYMLQDPELRYLLIASIDPNTSFNSAKFTANLLNTNWWKTHSSALRNSIQEQALDPATHDLKIRQKQDELRNIGMQAGLSLTEPEYLWEATLAVNNGWGDAEVKRNLIWTGAANHGDTGTSRSVAGTMGSTAQQIRQAASDYLLPMSDEQAGKFATDIFLGVNTLDAAKASLASWSAAQWQNKDPQMAAFMKQGGTARQYLDPQIQGVSQLLEISPDKVNLLDPKYSAIVNYQDPNQPKNPARVMTVQEAQQWARSQTDYRFTAGARKQAYDMTEQLGQLMGKAT